MATAQGCLLICFWCSHVGNISWPVMKNTIYMLQWFGIWGLDIFITCRWHLDSKEVKLVHSLLMKQSSRLLFILRTTLTFFVLRRQKAVSKSLSLLFNCWGKRFHTVLHSSPLVSQYLDAWQFTSMEQEYYDYAWLWPTVSLARSNCRLNVSHVC